MIKRWMAFGVAMLLTIFASVPVSVAEVNQSATAAGPQTYTVVVGADQVARGINLNAFFSGHCRDSCGRYRPLGGQLDRVSYGNVPHGRVRASIHGACARRGWVTCHG